MPALLKYLPNQVFGFPQELRQPIFSEHPLSYRDRSSALKLAETRMPFLSVTLT